MTSATSKLQSAPQTLRIDFSVPRRGAGYITTSVQPDADPREWGIDLIFPKHAPSNFVGFPVLHAAVTSLGARGYACMYGWMQLFKASTSALLTEHDTWDMDPIPMYDDLETPFAYFGHDPTLFDAPTRFETPRVDWLARAFLMYADDTLMSKTVRPIVCFEWGFTKEGDLITLKPVVQRPVGIFDEHLDLLKVKYPNWKFKGPEAK